LESLDPPDNFTQDERRSGAVILHCIGLFYMFVAIAIVCDECFVPALEVISEVLRLTPDVAGATFMAAGGSAPEFFTSLIGTCVGKKSDIGTGTIIGSAVFNVLFVIGACAIAAPEPLKLTWFPLARDSCFYAVDLIVVTVVFLDEKVMWWEAMILFFLYLSYITFMRYNERIEAWAKGESLEDEPEDCTADSRTEDAHQECWAKSRLDHDSAQWTQQESAEAKIAPESNSPIAAKAPQAAGTGEDRRGSHNKEEIVIPVPQMVQPSIADQRAVTAPLPTRLKKSDTKASRLKRSDSLRSDDKRHSSSSKDSHQQKLFRHTSMRVQTHANHTTLKRSSSKAAIDSLEEDEEGDQNEGMDSTGGSGLGRGKWIEDVEKQHIHEPFAPIGSAQAPTAPMDAAPRLIADLQLTDVVPSQELTSSTPNTASNRSSAAPSCRTSCCTNNSQVLGTSNQSGRICNSPSAFSESTNKSYTSSCEAMAHPEEDEEENEPLSIMPPDAGASKKDWLYYIATFPIVLCLVCTIPDVRRPYFEKFYIVTFFMSICWIAFFTWVMVWFATAIAITAGLEEHIMGLTVLAAGTSVPDLLTSMIVAREGHGDMAVSSSIGSNIFDVTVGLPIPWMLYCALNSMPVGIDTQGLEVCVLLLLGMLGFTIGTILYHGWVMTKGMGASLLCLYLLFEVIAIAITFAPDDSLKLIHV
jgi:sodium/potassium/calcium exchanger 2